MIALKQHKYSLWYAGTSVGVLVGVAARVADGDLTLLTHLLDRSDELLTALAGQGRQRQPNLLALRYGVEPQSCGLKGLADQGNA